MHTRNWPRTDIFFVSHVLWKLYLDINYILNKNIIKGKNIRTGDNTRTRTKVLLLSSQFFAWAIIPSLNTVTFYLCYDGFSSELIKRTEHKKRKRPLNSTYRLFSFTKMSCCAHSYCKLYLKKKTIEFLAVVASYRKKNL